MGEGFFCPVTAASLRKVRCFPLQALGTSDFTGAQSTAITSSPGSYIDLSASLVIFGRGDY